METTLKGAERYRKRVCVDFDTKSWEHPFEEGAHLERGVLSMMLLSLTSSILVERLKRDSGHVTLKW